MPTICSPRPSPSDAASGGVPSNQATVSYQGLLAQRFELLGLKKRTSELYLKYAQLFVTHSGGRPDQLGPEHVRSWLWGPARTKPLSPATMNMRIAALRHLFAALNRADAMAEIGAVRRRNPTAEVLSESEVQRLLSAAANAKHRAMVALLYGAGLRICELQTLEIEDVDLEGMFVYVRGRKPELDRFVPLSPQTVRAVREYWRSFWPTGQWLFPGRIPGCHMTRVGVSDAVRNCARLARISKKVHPNMLRRAFEVHLLELGADPHTMQALLGIGRARVPQVHRDLDEQARATVDLATRDRRRSTRPAARFGGRVSGPHADVRRDVLPHGGAVL